VSAPQTSPTPSTSATSSTASISVLDGGDVALEVLQAIGYRTTLSTATIVSYNMQDYEFWGHGTLSRLLLRQLSLGASIRLFTTPPPGRPTNQGFANKYKLLSELVKNGVSVFLNEKLHAKAYLFLDSVNVPSVVVGSANLTGPGFGMKHAPQDNLVEMALVSNDLTLYRDATIFVDATIVGDKRTEDFATWFARNSMEIGKAGLSRCRPQRSNARGPRRLSSRSHKGLQRHIAV
jgi:hypothetical protein